VVGDDSYKGGTRVREVPRSPPLVEVQHASLSAGLQQVPKKPTVGVVGANQTLRTSASH
jgi:hypothetical protein